MEFPFFSNNYRNYPRHHWTGEETPAMNPRHWAGVESSPSMNRQTRSPFPRELSRQKTPAASKVVDIPVTFIGSTRSEAMKETAAVKIQKVFRGLLVRKSVKKIDGIRKKVDEIEKRVSEKETILLMRRDDKERLKVNEMLMKLLLRLDSIRGVDSGVRVFRKSVTKKAIMLQERVDEIVVSGDVDMVDTGETVHEEECGGAEVVDQTVEIKGSENVVDEDMKANNHVESEHHNAGDYEAVVGEEAVDMVDTGDTVQEEECSAEVVDQTVEIKGSDNNVVDEDMKANNHVESEHHNAGDYEAEGEEAMVEKAGDQASELQHVPEVEAEKNCKGEEEEDLMDVQQQSELMIQGEKNQNEDSSLGVVEGGEEKKVVEENGSSNRDLMERMIKGNEVLTGLVAELCERQESQCRLLSSLLQRVENLEKAFRSDRSKRKKRNNNKL